MNKQIRTILLVLSSLVCFSLIVSACDDEPEEVVVPVCNGNVYVESATVTRVTPAPDEIYADNSTHTWDAPPYGIEVTGSGQANLNIFYGSSFLATYSAYAAGVGGYAEFTITKWNHEQEIIAQAGNFLVEDNDVNDLCDVALDAAGVSISSVGTKYVVTVRPEINEVTVAVLDGVVQVSSMGETTTLDAKTPEASLVVVTDGVIGPLLPVPDPGTLLDQVTTGEDIQVVPPPQDNLTMWADERLLPVLQELAAQFEKDTGIQVIVEPYPYSSIGEQYMAALEAGNAPDLVTLQHQQIYGLITSGSILPLENRLGPELLIPGTLQAFSFKGQLYGIPYIYDNLALVSNPEYISEIPPTWSELRSYSVELFSDIKPFTGFFITADGYYFYPIQSAFGGYIFGTFPDGTFNSQDLGMSSDGSLASAAWLEETINMQDVAWGQEDWALQAFQDRQTAMIMTGPWALQRLREMGVPFQIHSFPREVQESQPFLSVYGFLISRNSQAQDAAQNFLWNYLTTYQAVQAYSNTLLIPPARWDVLDNLENAELRAFGFAGVNGTPIPYIPEMNYVWNPWADALNSIMIKYMTGYDAFMTAQEIILKDIGQ